MARVLVSAFSTMEYASLKNLSTSPDVDEKLPISLSSPSSTPTLQLALSKNDKTIIASVIKSLLVGNITKGFGTRSFNTPLSSAVSRNHKLVVIEPQPRDDRILLVVCNYPHLDLIPTPLRAVHSNTIKSAVLRRHRKPNIHLLIAYDYIRIVRTRNQSSTCREHLCDPRGKGKLIIKQTRAPSTIVSHVLQFQWELGIHPHSVA